MKASMRRKDTKRYREKNGSSPSIPTSVNNSEYMDEAMVLADHGMEAEVFEVEQNEHAVNLHSSSSSSSQNTYSSGSSHSDSPLVAASSSPLSSRSKGSDSPGAVRKRLESKAKTGTVKGSSSGLQAGSLRGKMTVRKAKRTMQAELEKKITRANKTRMTLFRFSYPNKDMVFRGIIRIYCKEGLDQLAYKCVQITSETVCAELLPVMTEKFQLKHDPQKYSLYFGLNETDARCMDDAEFPLIEELQAALDPLTMESIFYLKLNNSKKISTVIPVRTNLGAAQIAGVDDNAYTELVNYDDARLSKVVGDQIAKMTSAHRTLLAVARTYLSLPPALREQKAEELIGCLADVIKAAKDLLLVVEAISKTLHEVVRNALTIITECISHQMTKLVTHIKRLAKNESNAINDVQPVSLVLEQYLRDVVHFIKDAVLCSKVSYGASSVNKHSLDRVYVGFIHYLVRCIIEELKVVAAGIKDSYRFATAALVAASERIVEAVEHTPSYVLFNPDKKAKFSALRETVAKHAERLIHATKIACGIWPPETAVFDVLSHCLRMTTPVIEYLQYAKQELVFKSTTFDLDELAVLQFQAKSYLDSKSASNSPSASPMTPRKDKSNDGDNNSTNDATPVVLSESDVSSFSHATPVTDSTAVSAATTPLSSPASKPAVASSLDPTRESFTSMKNPNRASISGHIGQYNISHRKNSVDSTPIVIVSEMEQADYNINNAVYVNVLFYYDNIKSQFGPVAELIEADDLSEINEKVGAICDIVRQAREECEAIETSRLDDLLVGVVESTKRNLLVVASEAILSGRLATAFWPPPNARERLLLALKSIYDPMEKFLSSMKIYIHELGTKIDLYNKHKQEQERQKERIAEMNQMLDQSKLVKQYKLGESPANSPIKSQASIPDSEFLKLLTLAGDDISGLAFEEKDNKKEIKGGLLEKLIQRITHPLRPEPSTLDTFILTFHSFTTPKRLMEALILRYAVEAPVANLSKSQKELYQRKVLIPIKLRVFSALKAWLNKSFDDFLENPSLEEMLTRFLATMSEELKSASQQLDKMLKHYKIYGPIRDESLRLDLKKPPPKSIVPLNLSAFTLLDLDPIEAARHLALIDHEIYKKIQPKECLDLAWSKKDLQYKAKNVLGLIDRFNKLLSWTVFSIVYELDLNKRIAILRHFIKIAEVLWEIHDFSALFAIMGGLEASAVHRLKKTWEGLNPKDKEVFAKLSQVVSSNGNHSRYRQELHTVEAPCIPFIGIYLTDLTFIEDGNSDFLKDMPNYINFKKRIQVAEVINRLRQFQLTPFVFTVVRQIHAYLSDITLPISEDDLFEQSLLAEPRE